MQDTAHDTADEASAGRPGLTRRQVIARGAAGGAVLWAVPTLQIIGATAADAASGPVVQPPTLPVEPAPTPTAGLPGHGIAVVKGATGAFVVKIDSGALGALSGLGNKDVDFLRDQGVVEGTHYRQPRSRDLAVFGVAGDGYGSTWYKPGGGGQAQAALFLSLPAGYDFVHAFTFDGSLKGPGNGNAQANAEGQADGQANANGQANGNAQGQPNGNANGHDKDKDKAKDKASGCGDGDKYTAAHVSGRLAYFVVTCNEPATGEG